MQTAWPATSPHARDAPLGAALGRRPQLTGTCPRGRKPFLFIYNSLQQQQHRRAQIHSSAHTSSFRFEVVFRRSQVPSGTFWSAERVTTQSSLRPTKGTSPGNVLTYAFLSSVPTSALFVPDCQGRMLPIGTKQLSASLHQLISADDFLHRLRRLCQQWWLAVAHVPAPVGLAPRSSWILAHVPVGLAPRSSWVLAHVPAGLAWRCSWVLGARQAVHPIAVCHSLFDLRCCWPLDTRTRCTSLLDTRCCSNTRFTVRLEPRRDDACNADIGVRDCSYHSSSSGELSATLPRGFQLTTATPTIPALTANFTSVTVGLNSTPIDSV